MSLFSSGASINEHQIWSSTALLLQGHTQRSYLFIWPSGRSSSLYLSSQGRGDGLWWILNFVLQFSLIAMLYISLFDLMFLVMAFNGCGSLFCRHMVVHCFSPFGLDDHFTNPLCVFFFYMCSPQYYITVSLLMSPILYPSVSILLSTIVLDVW